MKKAPASGSFSYSYETPTKYELLRIYEYCLKYVRNFCIKNWQMVKLSYI